MDLGRTIFSGWSATSRTRLSITPFLALHSLLCATSYGRSEIISSFGIRHYSCPPSKKIFGKLSKIESPRFQESRTIRVTEGSKWPGESILQSLNNSVINLWLVTSLCSSFGCLGASTVFLGPPPPCLSSWQVVAPGLLALAYSFLLAICLAFCCWCFFSTLQSIRLPSTQFDACVSLSVCLESVGCCAFV